MSITYKKCPKRNGEPTYETCLESEEVRNIYPNKFVLLRSLEVHIGDNKKCVDDVEIVRVLEDDEASNLLVK